VFDQEGNDELVSQKHSKVFILRPWSQAVQYWG